MQDFLKELKLECPIITKYLSYIECDKGWHDLILKTSKEIESYVKNQLSKGLISQEDDSCTIPSSAQIKEKFGILRWYMDNADDYIHDLIRVAEKESSRICEY